MFFRSGFKRTLCGSKWETYKSSWVTSTARYGCCLANRYMSSPEGTGTFVEVDSCSACPADTFTSVPNDETSCFVKMPDGCKGSKIKDFHVRTCDLRRAIDELNADGSGTHLTYGPVAEWDMSLVTDLSSAFYQKGSFDGDISKWQTQKVTTLHMSK